MPYLSDEELFKFGFKSLGKNVRISDKASIYDTEKMEIGDNVRIDDFCIVSGRVTIGPHSHITPMCLIAGGDPGVFLSAFCTLAYGVSIFAQSDDYSGATMVNSLIPKKYKAETMRPVCVGRQVVFGAHTVVMPGVVVGEGCSFGAMSLVNKSTNPWGIYFGQPAKRAKERSNRLLELEQEFLKQFNDDSV